MSSFGIATVVAAVALLAPPLAGAAERNPGLEELWEEYPLDAKRDQPMPRERLPEAKPRAAPQVRPAAAPQSDGGDTTIWIVVIAAGAAVLVAALAGALAYAGHAPRLPRVRLPVRPVLRPRLAGWNIAVPAAGRARSAHATLSRLIPTVERPPGRRVVKDLVRAASAALPRHRPKEAKMARTRDRGADAAEIDVLKSKPRAAEVPKHALAAAEAEALKRKPHADSTEALKAKAGGDRRPDKERLAAGDAVALKEKLAAAPEPAPPNPREHPTRAQPRTTRTRTRRALRPVPTPDFVPSRTETCEVRWWRGYFKSQFTAVATAADGTEAIIASSPYFRWRTSEPPEESPVTAAAFRMLVQTLEREGWMSAGRGEEWFAVRFERELVLDRIREWTELESST